MVVGTVEKRHAICDHRQYIFGSHKLAKQCPKTNPEGPGVQVQSLQLQTWIAFLMSATVLPINMARIPSWRFNNFQP